MQTGNLVLPLYMKYSSKAKDNDIELIRERIRKNKIFHHKYNPFFDSDLGRIYYEGIYEQNNPEHVEGTREHNQAPKNLYAYNLSKGLHKKAR